MFFKGYEIFGEKFKGSENKPENIKESKNFPLSEKNKGCETIRGAKFSSVRENEYEIF